MVIGFFIDTFFYLNVISHLNPSIIIDALIQTLAVGICGSDVHYWLHGSIGPFVLKKPMILGHETSGRVVEVGENVKNVKIGDIVAIEPGISCFKCDECKTGRYNLCEDMIFHATPPHDGI